MKRILMIAMLAVTMLSTFAAGYNSRQEALLTGIEKYLKSEGYSLERRDDGLKFMSNGETYYVELDKDDTDPMFVRVVKYIKFDDKIKRSDVMRNLKEYNSTVTVKAYCKERNLILSTEMFVTNTEQFKTVFGEVFPLLKEIVGEVNA